MAGQNLTHYSDILCIWAYIGQAVLEQVADTFGDRITVETRYCSVFGDTHQKIKRNWQDRGGFDGYRAHVIEVASGFPELNLHPDAWTNSRPVSSASPHLFLKAVECVEQDKGSTAAFGERLAARAAAEMRHAFFAEGKDIARWDQQRVIADRIGLRFEDILGHMETGAAMAGLAADYEMAKASRIDGSPTYVLNEGRQKLYGNVSRAIVEANIRELLDAGSRRNASPC